MRRIIRHVRSGKYFRQGQWTTDPKLAEHFPDCGQLINACLKHHLREVELVLQPNAGLTGPLETSVRLFQ
jgi:hypothetical protein